MKMPHLRGATMASLFTACGLLSLPAVAQKSATEEPFARAFHAYQAFRCEEALRLFAKVVVQSPNPRGYYYMGNCERWRANRAGAEKAYNQGLKLAQEGSEDRQDLESAMASLALAYDPAQQVEVFYEVARQAGLSPPAGLQAGIDPRLVPVHLDWVWENRVTSSFTPNSCAQGQRPTINVTTGGTSIITGEAWCQKKESANKSVGGFGMSVSIHDQSWDRQNPTHKGRTPQRDASGWTYIRTTSYGSTRILPVASAWIDYQEQTISSAYDAESKQHNELMQDSSTVARCKYKPSTNADMRRLSDGPQLEVLCVTKTSDGGFVQHTSILDLVTGRVLAYSYSVAGVDVVRHTSGHLGKIGEVMTTVETSNYGTSSITTTSRVTRTR